MARPARIEPQTAYDHAREGAILVCAYEDREKCEDLNAAGSIPLPDLQQREQGLSRDKELIFYCN